jgi:uncharacterized repeat protein (TIGR01451 family)
MYRKIINLASVIILIGIVFITWKPASSANPSPLQTYYMSLPEDDVLDMFYDDGGGNTARSPVRSVTYIAIGTDDTRVYYDQWEDGGYDADIANPGTNVYAAGTNPDGTQIWGDGDLANGCPPYINNTPNPCLTTTDDQLASGQVVVLDNSVAVEGSVGGPYSRDSSKIFFDGRDKFGVTQEVEVARSMWPSTPGSMMAGGVEMIDTSRWGDEYVSPAGEDTITTENDPFQDVRWFVMAGSGGSTFNIDLNGDGDLGDAGDLSNVVLAEGAKQYIDGILQGSRLTVVSGSDVQVNQLYADVGDTYEFRWDILIPLDDWTNDYYSPVGTTSGAAAGCTEVWIYNPSASAITVNYQFVGASGTINVASKDAVNSPIIPRDSGAHFYTNSSAELFLPFSLTDCTQGTTGLIYDWGNPLFPTEQLTPEALVGWAPGCTNESELGICKDVGGDNSYNYSRNVVWVTPQENTTIYVDEDGSGISCPSGDGAEQSIGASALQSVRIDDDPSSRQNVRDQFGSASYSNNNGSQNWSTSWSETGDDGSPSSGGIWITGGVLQFRDSGADAGRSIRRSRDLSGQIFSRLSFLLQSATGLDADDDLVVEMSSDGGTTWRTLKQYQGPMSTQRTEVFTISPYNSINTTVRFRLVDDLESGDTWSIDNVNIDYAPDGDFDMTASYIRTCDDTLIAVAYGQDPSLSGSNDDEALDLGTIIIPYGSYTHNLDITKASSAGGAVNPGDTITYTIQVTNNKRSTQTGIVISDTLPTGTTYVANSTVANGYQISSGTANYRDEFDFRLYSNNNGTMNWSNNWQEVGESDGPTSGAVLVYDDGSGDREYVLQVGNRSGGANNNRSAYRQASLSACTSATLTLDYRRVGFEDSDDYYIEASSDNVNYSTLLNLAAGNDTNYVASGNLSLNSYLGGSVYVRLRSIFTRAGTGDTDYVYVDNVNISCPYQTVTAITKDNITGGANPDLNNGVPPSLVGAVDGFSLLPSQTMTVTFRVTVDNPVTGGLTSIDNTASVTSNQQIYPKYASTTDLLTFVSIGDYVWLDVDGDGVQDSGEPGLSNVRIDLYDPGADGQPGGGDDILVATTYTDATGKYLFTRVAVGDYFVDVNGGVPTGLATSPGTSDPTSVFSVSAGESYLEADFGYLNSSSSVGIIGDFVWSDSNGNGIQDPGEPGLAGVEMALVSGSGADGIYGTSDDPVVATTSTLPNGRYYFTNVSPGEYVVVANVGTDGIPGSGDEELSGYTVTAGPQSPGMNVSTPITVTGGDVYLEADFGYSAPDTQDNQVGDRIWQDRNGNGVQDSGEPGLPGATVALIHDVNGDGSWDPDGIDNILGNADDEAIQASDISDSNGVYNFTGVPDGSFIVWVNDTAAVKDGFWQTYDPDEASPCTTCDDKSAVQLDPTGASSTPVVIDTKDFGYNPSGVIGDRLWSDVDGDGVQDAGEAGIPGVTVQLWKDVNNDGIFNNTVDTLVGTTTTDGSGNYLFTGLDAGVAYFSSVDNTQVALSGYTATTTDQETGANAPGIQIQVDLAVGGSYLDADFGFRNTSLHTIGDTVWNDIDGNGLQNIGETGIGGVTLALFKDTNGNEQLDADEPLLAPTTTGVNGEYTFPGLPDGNYMVVVTDQGNVLQGYQITSGLDHYPINLAGADNLNADFGYTRDAYMGSIGDTVWYDTDGDGELDSTERGTPNVLVNLYRDTNNDGIAETFVASIYTNSVGYYRFEGLISGIYEARVDDSNFNSGGPLSGQSSTSGGNTHGLIPLSEGEEYLLADFGYRGDGYSIGDYVWSDASNDGIQNPGEPGISGVVLELLNINNQVLATTTTGSDGYYLFSGISTAGDYQVRVAASNFNSGGPLEGYSVTTGPQSIGSTLATVNVNATTPSVVNVDFGFYNSDLGSIGDFVWQDNNMNGIQESGEPGLVNVTVDLYRDTNGDGVLQAGEPVIATAITAADGTYHFTGLDLDDGDGDFDYIVNVSDRYGVMAGMNSTTTNPLAVALSTSSANRNDVDFGFDDPELGDFVWNDANGNGIQDAGESGIGGVEVLLYVDVDHDGILTPGVDNLIRTTITTADGFYYFGGLAFQDFIIKLSGGNFSSGAVLSGFAITLQNQGSNDALDSDANANNEISITPFAAKDFTLDFGLYAPTGYSIGDLVWNDADQDGYKDASENGIGNVTLVLYRDLDGDGQIDPSDPVMSRDTTSSGGAYAFENLPNGSYVIQVDDRNGRLTDYTWINGNNPGQNNYSQTPTLAILVNNGNINYGDFSYYRSPDTPTAVDLVSFTAASTPWNVVISWETAMESNTLGFNLYRATSLDGERVLLNPDLIPSQSLGGIGAVYQFIDTDIQLGNTYYYWLEFIDASGKTEFGPVPAMILDNRLFLPVIQKF